MSVRQYGSCQFAIRGITTVVTVADPTALLTDELLQVAANQQVSHMELDGNQLTLCNMVTYEVTDWDADARCHVMRRIVPPVEPASKTKKDEGWS